MEKYKKLLIIAVVSLVVSSVFYIIVTKHFYGVSTDQALKYSEDALAYYCIGYKGILVKDTHISLTDAGNKLSNKDFSYALLLNFFPNLHAYNVKPIGSNAFILYGNKTDHFVVFYVLEKKFGGKIYMLDTKLTSGSGLKLTNSPFALQFATYSLNPSGRFPIG